MDKEAQYELCYNDRNVRDRGIVARRIALLCEQGRIAVKKGKTWLILEAAEKLLNKRKNDVITL